MPSTSVLTPENSAGPPHPPRDRGAEVRDAINNIDFKGSINYWKKSVEAQPDNANFNYKLGLCYFFSYDQQLKALPHFKVAIKNLSGTYDFSNEKE